MTTIHIPSANNTYSESLEVFFNKHHEDFNKIIDKIRDAKNNGQFSIRIYQSEIEPSIFQIQAIIEGYGYHVTSNDANDPYLIVNWYNIQPTTEDDSFEF